LFSSLSLNTAIASAMMLSLLFTCMVHFSFLEFGLGVHLQSRLQWKAMCYGPR
jgi:hypothetical protein